jgi:vacuolar-type H+-ATPase subunit E/Vma4
MSYDELINAIERDAYKERQRIIEGAEIEAKNIISNAEKELKKLKEDKLSELRHSFEQEKIRAIGNAKREAKAITLSAKAEIISEIFQETEKKIFELKKEKEYPDILTGLLKEAAEKGRLELCAEEFEVCVSEEDINIFKDEILQGARVKAERDIKEGVILASVDGRFRLVNTLKSRIGQVKADILPLLNRILFAESKKD